MRLSEKFWLWASQTLNMLAGGLPDESLSARAFREGRSSWVAKIDKLLGKDHCLRVYYAQRDRQTVR